MYLYTYIYSPILFHRKVRKTYRDMAKKHSEKHPHGRLRMRCQDNIKIDLRSKYMLQG